MDLYALPPEEFTAARDAAAKVDKALKTLRRPTVSAWVVNTLVRRDAGLLEDLLRLGADLAQAQAAGDAASLRTLGEQRRLLVAAVTARALELAGRKVSAAARLEVEQTLEAALADPPSAEAVRSGQLVRPLAFAGFGGVDLEGAVAPLPRAVAGTSPAGSKRPAGKAQSAEGEAAGAEGKARVKAEGKRVAALERAALEAQGALDDAVRKAERAAAALSTATDEATAAGAQQEEADTAVARARQALEDAEAAAREAQHRRTAAGRAHGEAERRASRATEAVEAAQAKAETARQALDAARRG